MYPASSFVALEARPNPPPSAHIPEIAEGLTHTIHGTGIFTYMNGYEWLIFTVNVGIPVPMDGMADEALVSRNMAMISDRKLPIPKQRKNIFNFECQKT